MSTHVGHFVSKKGRKGIEEIEEEMKESDRKGKGKWKKVKGQKK